MKRAVALLLLLSLLGCSGDDDDAASSTTSERQMSTTSGDITTSTTAAEREESLRLTRECAGIDAFSDTQLSWIADGRIWVAGTSGDQRRCVAEFDGDARLQWGGAGDRLFAGDRSVLLADGPKDILGDDDIAQGWSRPTGRALVVRRGDAMHKLSLEGEPPIELPGFALGVVEPLYHPSGTAIAAIEHASNNVVLVNNRGVSPQWVLGTEVADDIDDFAFSAGGDLVFVARHDAEWHLHRLVLGEDVASDVLIASTEIEDVTTSYWDNSAVAASRGTCREPGELYVEIGEEQRDLTGTAVERGVPVGWTPDDDLVVLVGETCEEDGADTGDLYVVSGTDAILVAEGVRAPAVRAVLPPPSPPPPELAPAPA
jgi:hypothetical protein